MAAAIHHEILRLAHLRARLRETACPSGVRSLRMTSWLRLRQGTAAGAGAAAAAVGRLSARRRVQTAAPSRRRSQLRVEEAPGHGTHFVENLEHVCSSDATRSLPPSLVLPPSLPSDPAAASCRDPCLRRFLRPYLYLSVWHAVSHELGIRLRLWLRRDRRRRRRDQ